MQDIHKDTNSLNYYNNVESSSFCFTIIFHIGSSWQSQLANFYQRPFGSWQN